MVNTKVGKLSIDKKTFGFSTASGGIILKTDNYHHLLFGQLPKEYFKAKIGNNFAANALKNILNTFGGSPNEQFRLVLTGVWLELDWDRPPPLKSF